VLLNQVKIPIDPKMTEETVVAPVAATPSKPAKSPKTAKAPKAGSAAKPKKAKTPAAHPSYIDMVKAAVLALKDRTGSSRQAILKYILANYQVGSDSKVSLLIYK
jgi:histone H1/5